MTQRSGYIKERPAPAPAPAPAYTSCPCLHQLVSIPPASPAYTSWCPYHPPPWSLPGSLELSPPPPATRSPTLNPLALLPKYYHPKHCHPSQFTPTHPFSPTLPPNLLPHFLPNPIHGSSPILGSSCACRRVASERWQNGNAKRACHHMRLGSVGRVGPGSGHWRGHWLGRWVWRGVGVAGRWCGGRRDVGACREGKSGVVGVWEHGGGCCEQRRHAPIQQIDHDSDGREAKHSH